MAPVCRDSGPVSASLNGRTGSQPVTWLSSREEIGETPVQFLETSWVETARRQLKTIGLSLEEVAVGLVGSDLQFPEGRPYCGSKDVGAVDGAGVAV